MQQRIITHQQWPELKSYNAIKLPRDEFIQLLRRNNEDHPIFITTELDICKIPRIITNKLISIANENLEEYERKSISCTDINEAIDYINTPFKDDGYSYIFSGFVGMRKLELHKKLRGLVNVMNDTSVISTLDYIHYVRIEYESDRALENIECQLKNMVNRESIKSISEKDQLYITLKHSSHIPSTVKLSNLISIADDEIWIIKPSGRRAFGGEGINIILNNEELSTLKQKITAGKYDRSWKWIASKYINNPLLHNGYKFHFRCYLMISTWGEIQLYDKYVIITAENKYINSDYHNKKIHDTHGKHLDTVTLFPDDFNDTQNNKRKIINSVNNIKYDIEQVIKNKVYPYNESYSAYEILGLDIMIDENYKAWLLEVNSGIGRAAGSFMYNKKYYEFTNDSLKWEYKYGVQPGLNQLDNTELYTILPLDKLAEDERLKIERWFPSIDKIYNIMQGEKSYSLNERTNMMWTIFNNEIEEIVGYIYTNNLKKFKLKLFSQTEMPEEIMKNILHEINRFTGNNYSKFRLQDDEFKLFN